MSVAPFAPTATPPLPALPEHVVAEDGAHLHLRQWPAAAGTVPRGLVQIVHGLGEHINRHAALAGWLAAHGWHVAGHDHRGHGSSTGPRGDVPDRDALLRDLAGVVQVLRPLAGGGRHVLLGHSLGGLVAARLCAEALAPVPQPWAAAVAGLDALVLSSPALALRMNPLQKLMLGLGRRFAPGAAAGNGLDPGWISRTRHVVSAYVSDPLVHDRITPRLASFLADAGPDVLAAAPRWERPTLLQWAGADRCVDPAGSVRFAAAAPSAVVTRRPYPGLYHEIYNEPQREAVLADLAGWLAALP